MIDEQIRDGDFVIVEDRKTADNGEMVIALVGGIGRHAEEVLPRERPHPAPAGQPGDAAAAVRRVPGAGAGRRRRSDAKILSGYVQANQLHDRSGRSGGPGARQARVRELLRGRAHALRSHADVLRRAAAVERDIEQAEASQTVRAPVVARIALPFAVVPGLDRRAAGTDAGGAGSAGHAHAEGWPKGPLH